MRTLLLLLFGIALLAPAAHAENRHIRFGVQIAPENASYAELVETFGVIEDAGYDDAWLNDHFMPVLGDKDGSNFESWTLLAALAEHTKKIRIGILVTGNTYRHPAVLAKMATTVDHVSGGRLEFGIGAGWEEFEHRAYGIPFYTPHERAKRLEESLAVITKLWTQEHPSFSGKYYQLLDAPFAPKPLQKPHPPIVVGGQGVKWILPIVARYADEWNVPVGVDPDGIRTRLEILRRECEKIGRSPCVREVSVFLPLVNITNVPFAETFTQLGARILAGEAASRSVLAGSAADITKKIQSYVDAGATSVVITTRPGRNHELMRRFATEIVPAFRAVAASAAPPAP